MDPFANGIDPGSISAALRAIAAALADNRESHWYSSPQAFAVIGAIVGGSLTLFGSFLTNRHHAKESERQFHREREQKTKEWRIEQLRALYKESYRVGAWLVASWREVIRITQIDLKEGSGKKDELHARRIKFFEWMTIARRDNPVEPFLLDVRIFLPHHTEQVENVVRLIYEYADKIETNANLTYEGGTNQMDYPALQNALLAVEKSLREIRSTLEASLRDLIR